MKKDLESIDLSKLHQPVIGIDEVGRGCLAGPVAAAAVILSNEKKYSFYPDSKKISEEQRELLSQEIYSIHTVGLGWAQVEEIDRVNILQATFLAMKRALSHLPFKTGTLLIDGRDRIPGLDLWHQVPVIKGDQKVRAISAASIVAKVARDQFMKQLANEVVGYGFEKHKGYGTAFHRQKIQELGPSTWHRQTFGGVKEYVEKLSVSL